MLWVKKEIACLKKTEKAIQKQPNKTLKKSAVGEFTRPHDTLILNLN